MGKSARTRKCACKTRYVPLQVMGLHVKYHYYTMCSLQDMDLNQELNQSVTDVHMDGQTMVTTIICHVHNRDGTLLLIRFGTDCLQKYVG